MSFFPSYLYVGPDSAGKRELAKNFAKGINCLNTKDTTPCRRCISCRKIDKEIHPDVFFVEPKGASSSIGIDQIREVIQRANLKPYEGKSKVFIINNAHSMNVQASNAFLKTLEEPPENTISILISRSEKLLLPTIVSRCHIIRIALRGPDGSLNIPARIGRGRISNSIANAYDREELKENLEFFISFFRDMFLYKVVGDGAKLFHIDRIGQIKSQCQKFTIEKLDYLIKKIITLRSYIDYNVNPKIIMDVLNNEVKSDA